MLTSPQNRTRLQQDCMYSKLTLTAPKPCLPQPAAAPRCARPPESTSCKAPCPALHMEHRAVPPCSVGQAGSLLLLRNQSQPSSVSTSGLLCPALHKYPDSTQFLRNWQQGNTISGRWDLLEPTCSHWVTASELEGKGNQPPAHLHLLHRSTVPALPCNAE